MTARIAKPHTVAPKAYEAMLALETTLRNSGIDLGLFHLVKTRASQINACAYCIHMHTTDARAAGESDARLHLLAAWRESSLFSESERAALAWTESLTLLPQRGAPDEEFGELERHFDAAQIVNLTLLIGAINTWNRLAVGLRLPHSVRAEDRSHA
jgi:AhpD family alkylhydroperoxidase